MHRTLAGDLDQLVGQRRVDAAFDADRALEPVDLAGAALGRLAAVGGLVGEQMVAARGHEVLELAGASMYQVL